MRKIIGLLFILACTISLSNCSNKNCQKENRYDSLSKERFKQPDKAHYP